MPEAPDTLFYRGPIKDPYGTSFKKNDGIALYWRDRQTGSVVMVVAYLADVTTSQRWVKYVNPDVGHFILSETDAEFRKRHELVGNTSSRFS